MKMRHWLPILLLFLLIVPNSALAAEQVIKDQADKLNYSLGIDLGQRLQRDGLPFEPNILWQALHEGMAGATQPADTGASYELGYVLGVEMAQKEVELRGPALWQGLYDAVDFAPLRLREVEIKALLREMRGMPQQPKAATPVADKPAAAKMDEEPPPKVYRLPGQKFLAENLEKEGVIALPSGLQYRVIQEGKGKRPQLTDTVLINYQGRSVEGRVFSGSFQRGIPTPQELVVGKLIPGLTEALTMMREGAHWEIYIPTRLAFKDTGPMAGQTVIYDLEFVEILPPLLPVE